MITVGLDFGTHQTKICIEKKEGVECNYSFFKFEDECHREFYTLPSIINVSANGLLSYGYIPRKAHGRIIRYFKQGAFRIASEIQMSPINSIYFSCWYISYILFDLEKEYGRDFTIQMGAPSDSGHLDEAKQTAVRILASAYRLVEVVFKNDKERFLATDMKTLTELTEIVLYSKKLKDEYGILVFPEAYACLKPLTSRGKIASGMSLMIDIGGGTTDISFFTIEDNMPQVYDFFSISKGLNYLTKAASSNNDQRKILNVVSSEEIDTARLCVFNKDIKKQCTELIIKLTKEFENQTTLNVHRLNTALDNRPLIYCGGGSTFKILHAVYLGFKDKKLISHQEWDIKSVVDADEIIDNGLCPILSTAYGLAISVPNDDIKKKPFKDIFEKIRGAEEQQSKSSSNSTFGSAYGDFDYALDFNARK